MHAAFFVKALLTDLVLSWNMIPIRTTYPQAAIDLLKKDEFDIAIVDQHMPFMDGFSLVEKIRNLDNCKNLPVIILAIMSKGFRKLDPSLRNSISLINKPVKFALHLTCPKR